MVAQIKTAPPKAKPAQTPDNLAPTAPLVTPIRGNVQVFIAPHRHLHADIIAQALRVAGQGTKVLLVQLFQAGINQGLQNPRYLVENFEWLRCDADRDLSNPDIELTEAEKTEVIALWDYAKTTLQSSKVGLVVLDEVNLLVARSLITEEELLEVLEKRSPKVNVILTGRSMPESVSSYADQVTHRRS